MQKKSLNFLREGSEQHITRRTCMEDFFKKFSLFYAEHDMNIEIKKIIKRHNPKI